MMERTGVVFRSPGASLFVFFWLVLLLLSQVALCAVAIGLASSPWIGVAIMAVSVAVCGYRAGRMSARVGSDGQVVIKNLVRTYRFNATQIVSLDEGMPGRGRVLTRGYRVKWWLRIRLDSGSLVYPSALLRRLDRADHDAFASAVGHTMLR